MNLKLLLSAGPPTPRPPLAPALSIRILRRGIGRGALGREPTELVKAA